MNQTAYFLVSIQDVDFSEINDSETYFAVIANKTKAGINGGDLKISKRVFTHILIEKELPINDIEPTNDMDRSDVVRYGQQCFEAGYYSCLNKPKLAVNEPLKTAEEQKEDNLKLLVRINEYMDKINIIESKLDIANKALDNITRATDPENSQHKLFWRIAHEALSQTTNTK